MKWEEGSLSLFLFSTLNRRKRVSNRLLSLFSVQLLSKEFGFAAEGLNDQGSVCFLCFPNMPCVFFFFAVCSAFLKKKWQGKISQSDKKPRVTGPICYPGRSNAKDRVRTLSWQEELRMVNSKLLWRSCHYALGVGAETEFGLSLEPYWSRTVFFSPKSNTWVDSPLMESVRKLTDCYKHGCKLWPYWKDYFVPRSMYHIGSCKWLVYFQMLHKKSEGKVSY